MGLCFNVGSGWRWFGWFAGGVVLISGFCWRFWWFGVELLPWGWHNIALGRVFGCFDVWFGNCGFELIYCGF